MELRELVESTLDELDKRLMEDRIDLDILEKEIIVEDTIKSEDREFLSNIREKMVVLFEGLQDEEIKDKEAKFELTLDFMEYLLATIDEKLGKI
jgi:hypothetical protein